MQNKLSQNQIESVQERYHDHPLYVACKRAFGQYETQMQRLLFAPEEIFLESAIILDNLLTEPENAKKYVSDLWIELKRKIRYWDRDAPQDDLDKIVGAILYVAAAVLCHHPHPFYNDELKEMMLSETKGQMKVSAKEEERFIVQLSLCAEGLEKWLTEYIESDSLLSEEILANDDSYGENKADKDNTSLPHHFSLPNEETNIARLKRVLAKLKKENYIHKNTKVKDWIFVCTGVGEEPEKPIQWQKDDDELGFFVQQFFNDKRKWDRAVHCFLLKNNDVPNATNLRTNVTKKAEKTEPLFKIIHVK